MNFAPIVRFSTKYFPRLSYRFRALRRKTPSATAAEDFQIWERDLIQMAAERGMVTSERHHPNDFYGHARTFKKLVGQPDDYALKVSIPHGVRYDGKFWEHDFHKDFSIGFVSSPFRADLLRGRVPGRIVSVGPLIHYAASALGPDAFAKASKILGRTLLVFPAHSTHLSEVNYSVQELISRIADLGRSFQSIVVCLYWKDILSGIAASYQSAGFKVVTAGHIYDPLFLPRLRSLIELSSMTVSNRQGTHVGYCLHLGKPHHIFTQSVKIVFDRPDATQIPHELGEGDRLARKFGDFQECITPEQSAAVDLYWGTSHVKSTDEINTLLCQAESDYWHRQRLVKK